MAKKKAAPQDEKRAAAEYYRLNTRAVDDLVNATAENSPQVSEEELRKYRSGPKLKVADWVRIVLIKWWFAGMVCFFFLWGLGTYLPHQLDQLLVVGIALGFVTDLLTNNVLRFFEKTPGANARWMMFPRKGYASLPLNLIYAFVLLLAVVGTYHVLNTVIMAVTGAGDTLPLGVEPILFGLITLGWDLLLIKMKHTLVAIGRDAARKASGQG